MPNSFAEALQTRCRAAQTRGKLSHSQVIALLMLKTSYASSTIYRHLDGESLPRDEDGAKRYADALGERNGHLLAAYRRSKAERESGAVMAHIAKLGGTVGMVLALALAGSWWCSGELSVEGLWCTSDRIVDTFGGNQLGL